jgi:hypothetical protein
MKGPFFAFVGVALLLGFAPGCGDEQKAPGAASNAQAGASGSKALAGAGGVVNVAGAGGVGGAVGMSAGGGAGAGASGAAGSSGGAATAGAGGVSGGGSGGACSATPATLSPWPGKNAVKTLEQKSLFQSDLSGLTYEPAGAGAGVLWAVNNLSGKLYRLLPSADGFAPDTANGWSAGKLLHYTGGQGTPDAEGVTFGKDVADGVYVCAEHDADDASTSRLSVLRYDVSGAAAALTATHEWNVTALLPKVGANAGLEAITWVPDSYLTSHGFFDESKAHGYDPGDYPNHGTGLFLVGVEETGKIHVLALNHQNGSAAAISTIATPNAGVMGLEFDRDAGNLWFNCDDGCGNKSGILGLDTQGSSPTRGLFVLRRQFARPSTLPDSNNEGIALAPDSECTDGFKPFYWTDDADQDGFSLRMDSIPCGACF